MGKRFFWVVFLALVAPLAAIGIMASPFGYLGALVYTKGRNAMAEAVLDVTVQAELDGKALTIRRVVRCEGGSTATDDGAKLLFTARPGYAVEDLGRGDMLVLPLQGLCKAAVKAEWTFPSWQMSVRPGHGFAPLAMVAAADGSVMANVQPQASGRLTVKGADVALGDLAASATAQPALPPGFATTEFHYAMLTPVPADLLAYYPVLAQLAGQGARVVPVEVLPPEIAFATFRFPAEAEKLAAWPDAGRIATPMQQHPLPSLIGLRRVGDRLEAETSPGILTLHPQPLAGASGSVRGMDIAIAQGSPWRRIVVDAAGLPSLLEFKTARFAAE